MLGKWQAGLLGAALAMSAGAFWLVAPAAPQASQRESLMKSFSAGDYTDAHDGLRNFALDPADDPSLVSQDLTTAIQCLYNLGRVDEIDAFREGVITAHKGNWRLLETAATSYTNGEHFGFIV